jgi:hypothetical protein
MRRPYLYIFTWLVLFVFFSIRISAQQIVLVSSSGQFYSLDISSGSCSTSPLNQGGYFGYSTALYKDTLYYTDSYGNLYKTILGNNNFLQQIDTGVYSDVLTADINGSLLWVDRNSNNLVLFNPHTNITDTLGMLNYYPAGDLFFITSF